MRCRHCGQEIRDIRGVDPSIPYVHTATGNSFCDVTSPASAVTNAGRDDRTEAEPGKACSTRTGRLTGQVICTRCSPDCEHYICTHEEEPACTSR